MLLHETVTATAVLGLVAVLLWEPDEEGLSMARADVSVRNGALTLPELAERINTEHTAAETAINGALERARRCGDLLLQAKAQCEHGQWQGWVQDNFRGSERTARLYMRIAAHWPEVEAKRQDLAVLGIEGAIGLLAEPRETNGGEPDGAEQPPARAPEPVSHASHDEPATRGVAAAEPARRKPRPEPEPLPEGVEPDDTDPVEQLGKELEAAARRIAELEAENASLQADDTGAEIRRLSALRAREQANNMGLQREIDALRDHLNRRDKLLGRIRKVLGLDRDGDILATIEKLAA